MIKTHNKYMTKKLPTSGWMKRGINNYKHDRTRKLCSYCKYYTTYCTKNYKEIFNKTGRCKHYCRRNASGKDSSTGNQKVSVSDWLSGLEI